MAEKGASAHHNQPENPVLLRDVFVDAQGQSTGFEVTSQHIYLSHDGFRALQPIPLAPESESYNAVSPDVRAQIARKIALIVPTLAETKKEYLRDHVFRVLEKIAQDQLPRVRQMMAEELKSLPGAPPSAIRDLAWDDDLGVCAPILEYSPLLTDQDLLELIVTSDIPGVWEAIARRKHVSKGVSSALIRTDHVNTVHYLLSNQGAEFDDESLNRVINHEPEIEIWLEDLKARPELSQRIVNRIAGLVSASIVSELEFVDRMEQPVARNLAKAVRSRLVMPAIDRDKIAEEKVRDMFEAGKLDEEVISDAIATGEKEFILHGLAKLSGLSKDRVRRMIASQNAKAVTALSWKAGLSMRTAMQLQLRTAQIPHTQMLYAREGTHYPISETTCKEYIRHFKD